MHGLEQFTYYISIISLKKKNTKKHAKIILQNITTMPKMYHISLYAISHCKLLEGHIPNYFLITGNSFPGYWHWAGKME